MKIPDIWLERSRERERTLRSLPSRATWLGPVSLSTSRNSCCAFLRLEVSRSSLEHMCFESQSLNLYFPLSQSVQNKNRYYINHQSHVSLWKFPNTKQKPVEKTALGFLYIYLNSKFLWLIKKKLWLIFFAPIFFMFFRSEPKLYNNVMTFCILLLKF